MEFIKVAEGLSIKACEIEAVESGMGNTCVIHTHHKIYSSTLSYDAVLQLLEMHHKKEEPEEKDSKEMNILKTIGTFAG